MKIKRYLVKNMPEAYERIKKDLGSDAIIISSRKVRTGGFFGLFGTKMIEVTAALEREQEKPSVDAIDGGSQVGEELAHMKSMLKKIVHNFDSEPGSNDVLRQALENVEINSQLIDKMLEGIDGNSEDFEDGHVVWEVLLTRLANKLDIERHTPENNVYAFVGPTGVGKTTTLAKLAAHYAFSHGKSLGLITIDTYRIGAVEQLKIYADILGSEVDVVMTPDQLKQAVDRHRDKDLILIDTAGRPAASQMSLSEIRTFLEVVEPLEVYLVLSCTTKDRDLEYIAEAYKTLNYTQLIFTKTDETNSLGSIVNIAQSVKKPVAYVTNGQGVPDDIVPAEPNKLARLILREVK
ncbi:MAG: flagellar biosynthesis protein FlhF [Clostridia bacterium]|nr:flagellar biosynthesis protein FlhF [Clostridia bacterium]